MAVTLQGLGTRVVNEVSSMFDRFFGERRAVRHFNARTVDEALSLLKRYPGEARIIAGGVDIVGLIKQKVVMPEVLVNLKTIEGLEYIKEDTDCLRLGALTRLSDIERSVAVKQNYGVLALAAHLVASPNVRNMATVAGNLLQSVRCWYYRRPPETGITFYCLRKGGDKCYAVDGDNRFHSIVGGDGCYAACESDLAPALVALKAKATIASPGGTRTVPVEELFAVMGNTLKPGEIITEIEVPRPVSTTRQNFIKFRPRKVIDPAISSVAAVITMDSGIVTGARLVCGGIAPVPFRALAAEEALIGHPVTEDTAEEAAEAVISKFVPLSNNAYKAPITKTILKRAVMGSIDIQD